ncbi:hypothetical protein [Paenibacillus andongensis]|uniref:hypothetical protein n=1 Tax=Paenibacillus andongensis TaxID=2975482 RepID=UPI0021BAE563|nr:hypothetical protein [Paenibacillus andongensis]
MLTNMEERKITNGDIDLMIAEIEEGWKELSMIGRSCRDIREDLVRLSQVLDELIY